MTDHPPPWLRSPRWDGPVGIVESYDSDLLAFLADRPGLLDDLDREHAADPHNACPACPGIPDGAPASRCLVRLTIDHAQRVRAARASVVPAQRTPRTETTMSNTYAFAFPDPDRPARMMMLLGLLGLEPAIPDIRLRDVWLERVPDDAGVDRLQVALYARAGGPNREVHAAELDRIREHTGFVSDRDDDFDNTFLTLRLRLDDNRVHALAGGELGVEQVLWDSAHVGEVDTAARWQEAMARAERGEFTAAQIAAADQLVAKLRDAMQQPGVTVVHPPRMPGDGS